MHRGDGPTELANNLGITYSYLTVLISGEKPISSVNRSIMVAAAEYLDVPVAQVYLWSGALEPTDFVHVSQLREMSGEIFDVMARNPEWGGYMPRKGLWVSLPDQVKELITLMFERLNDVNLLKKVVVSPAQSAQQTLDSAENESHHH